MNTSLSHSRSRWLVVFLFAVAMAWVESAVVYYLRTMIDRIVPHQPDPLPIVGGIGSAELVRELATMIMLLCAGWLAGNSLRTRIGYTAIAFGTWDIFYYVFLKVMCDWPSSLLEWDLLFLLPLPWWGPVLAPLLIAVLMVLWGTVSTQRTRERIQGRSELFSWALASGGIALALWVFMADSLRARTGGIEAIRTVLPARFEWTWFCLGLGLMSAPLVESWRAARRAGAESEGLTAGEARLDSGGSTV
jgi:hypothetical protein